ncbi:roadblock/LC7 domain-containing protein [Catenuloplanes atrovinosus]|uniref:Regulator of Ras-like GTPase activity (Roadblock/LC7/MglB family) n=1 Tax=Catenuloplanes atrovinosus TaxID=137266 RepID=A0AAE3YUZ5_9ACTN|nr:roadblock/LC7 domain-containing protein [Catenuloplanes atrovinosus]MDR7280384.1 putative regulator of Ras-like GTPase activity (Roadblock/LC7/MglB family) [Catenuloplanes atrovinosus]
MSIDAGPDTTAHRFNWLITNFVRGTAGVREAVAVSSDGMLIATSAGLSRADADHLAAIVSGLSSLARSAARRYEFTGLKLIMIEMTSGFLIVSALGGGTCLGVLAVGDCDVALIGYEIALLGERVGDLLTPALIAESRRTLPR